MSYRRYQVLGLDCLKLCVGFLRRRSLGNSHLRARVELYEKGPDGWRVVGNASNPREQETGG